MSFKEKRKSASSGSVNPKAKKAKIDHSLPSRIASKSSGAAGSNKAQKKFERKGQTATSAKNSGKDKNALSSALSSKASSASQRRVKADDEKPVKVARGKKPVADSNAETEWDSDPIEESDTGEESGADDGVSWPSGDEQGGADGYDETMEDDGFQEDDEGGVKVTTDNGTEAAKDTKLNGTSSRESHVKQKELLKERKAAKPNANEIARSKKLWERLRRSSHVPKDERKKLVAELFELITGRVREFVLKHDAGRVIQTALKYGNPDQRKMIARELAGEMAGLAEGKYAKFMIGKLVSYGDKEIRDMVVPDFFGKARRMIRHPEASWILDDIYRGAASKEQKARLLREWYGAEFALFAGKSTETVESAELSEILAKHPEKRKSIMRYLWEMINQLVQKKTTGFTMLHDAMLQYYLNTEPGSEEANEFLELLKGDEEHDLMKNLAFTPSGSRVVSLAFAYGTAKDRKLLLRAYKDTVAMMAFDQIAHQVLIAACEVVDDTVLITKSIFSELVPKDFGSASEQQVSDAVALASDINAREVILLPFVERQIALLRSGEQQKLEEIHEIRKTYSKKDPELRKAELAKALSSPLLQLIERQAAKLVQTSFGCLFITEVMIKASGDKSGAIAAIAKLAASDDAATAAALETPAGGKMLKTLVQGGRFDLESKKVVPCEPRLHFVDALHEEVGAETVAGWATGPMTFVVLAMLETNDWEDSKKQDKLKERLRKEKKQLEALAKEAESSSKGEKEEKRGKAKGKDSKSDANKDKDKDKKQGSRSIGAKGAKMILEAL